MATVGNWFLGLDTATEWRSLALWSPDEGVSHRDEERLGRASSARLMPDLVAFLESCGVGREMLAGIGVGVGPGSYTGTRVGIAVALGLGRALGVPVTGSCSLEAVLFGALAPGESGWALFDARRGRVHALLATRRSEDVAPLRGPLLLARSELDDEPLRRLEGAAPDALWHARSVPGGRPPEPRYG